jgi:alanine-synthesizing transaminase
LDRFSERLAWATPRNPYSLLLQEKRRTAVRLLDLTVANPTEAFADYPHKDIAHAYGALPHFRYEPEAIGTRSARQLVAGWYHAQGIPASADRLALTASTSEAYAILFKLLCDPGDQILIPCPSYPLFEYLARAECVRTAPYQLLYDGSWFIDFESLEKSISARTKAIVVVNPNNPTGSFLKQPEVKRLALLAERYQLAIISDEVFMTYPASSADRTQVRTFIGRDDVLSFSLNGLSKAAGMPQMKLAWVAVNGPRSQVDAAWPKLELLLDSYLSVATPVQGALAALLDIGARIHSSIASRVQDNRRTLHVLANTSVETLAAEGGWSAILQIPNIRSEEEWITELLTAYDTVVQPGYFYDMPKEAYLVLSLLTNPPDFAEGIARLKRLAGNG